MSNYLADLRMTVPEVERHDLLVDLLLPKHRLCLPSIFCQASMDKTRVVGIEPGNKNVHVTRTADVDKETRTCAGEEEPG